MAACLPRNRRAFGLSPDRRPGLQRTPMGPVSSERRELGVSTCACAFGEGASTTWGHEEPDLAAHLARRSHAATGCHLRPRPTLSLHVCGSLTCELEGHSAKESYQPIAQMRKLRLCKPEQLDLTTNFQGLHQ